MRKMQKAKVLKTTTSLIAGFVVLASCSSPTELLKVGGVERVKIEQEEYKKPQFFIGDYQAPKKQASRSIASVKDTSKLSKKESKKLKALSNRQMYFLTFYKQHKDLGKIIGEESKVNSCPSFHNVLLSHEKAMKSQLTKYSLKQDFQMVKSDARNTSVFPVLALPYNNKTDLYTKLVQEGWEGSEKHLKTALKNHYQNSEKEMAELCDRGVSPGYYVFENLVTYFGENKDFHGTKDGLKALLKIPVLANMVVLDNLKQSNYHFNQDSNFDKWLLERTNADWFKSFVFEMKRKRDTHISSNFIRK